MRSVVEGPGPDLDRWTFVEKALASSRFPFRVGGSDPETP